MSLAVIVPAAGTSSRYGKNKLFETLAGQSVLARTLGVFLGRADVQLVILPTTPGVNLLDIAPPDAANLLRHPKIRLCSGGNCRAQSVRNALKLVPDSIEWVAVHDGARPLISQALIDQTLTAARQHGAAVPAMSVTLTIKRAKGPLPALVQETIPRDQLWAMQTPQIMRASALGDAFARCPLPLEQVTDDVQLIELAGGRVCLVAGEERNLKITTPIDLHLAEAFLR